MNEQDDSDEAQAAVIDQRIGQGFAFLRDVIDDPTVVEAIPTGASLRFRDVAIAQGQVRVQVRLTAYRAPEDRRWGARVTGFTSEFVPWASAFVDRLARDSAGFAVDATRGTAEAALDALEAELRDAAQVEAIPL
jgi:hypothetical protein